MGPTTSEHRDRTDPPHAPVAVRLATFAAGAAAFVGTRVWLEETDLVSGWIWRFLLSCVLAAICSTAVRLVLTRFLARRLPRSGSTVRALSDSPPGAEPQRSAGGDDTRQS